MARVCWPVDFATLTRDRAKRLIGSAVAAERRTAEAFNKGVASQDELWAALEYTEALRVFALTGERP